jgi:iron(III) transport system permease protein
MVAAAMPGTVRSFAIRMPRIDPIVVAALIPAGLIVALLIETLWLSVRTDVTGGSFTFENFRTVFADPIAFGALANTLVFATVTVAVSLAIGVPLAWIIERTDFAPKSASVAALTMGLLIPGFMTAMGWLFLFHPRAGLANLMWMDLTGGSEPLFNVVSVWSMGLIEGLTLAPVVFVMTAASLRAIDSSLEEAAAVNGAGLWTTLSRVTIPLILPSILGAAFYVFVIGIAAFDLPAVIGGSSRIYLFSTFVTLQINPTEGLPNYGIAAAFSTFMIVLGLGMSWLYGRMLARARQYQTVSGKSYKPRVTKLGKARYLAGGFVVLYLSLAILLPFAMLVWTSLIPFLEPPSADAFARVGFDNFRDLPWETILPALQTTLILVVAAPTLALCVSALFSWITLRSKSRFRFFFEVAAFLPHAVPNIIFGFAILIATLYIFTWPFDLYGSMAALIVALALNKISFGSRITNGAIIQIGSELDEAAYMSGAKPLTVLRRIIIPLVRPAILYGYLWLAMLTFRELALSNILSSPERMTLPVAIYGLFKTGQTGQAAAASLLLIGLLLPLIAIYLVFSRRRTEGAPI